jgi:hypothetical protein
MSPNQLSDGSISAGSATDLLVTGPRSTHCRRPGRPTPRRQTNRWSPGRSPQAVPGPLRSRPGVTCKAPSPSWRLEWSRGAVIVDRVRLALVRGLRHRQFDRLDLAVPPQDRDDRALAREADDVALPIDPGGRAAIVHGRLGHLAVAVHERELKGTPAAAAAARSAPPAVCDAPLAVSRSAGFDGTRECVRHEVILFVDGPGREPLRLLPDAVRSAPGCRRLRGIAGGCRRTVSNGLGYRSVRFAPWDTCDSRAAAVKHLRNA